LLFLFLFLFLFLLLGTMEKDERKEIEEKLKLTLQSLTEVEGIFGDLQPNSPNVLRTKM